MSKEKKAEVKYVNLNTTLVVAVVCLIAGFLGGVIYSTYKSGSDGVNQSLLYKAPAPGQSSVTAQKTEMILALEMKVAEDPGNMDAWIQLGNLYFDTNNPQKAIKAYGKYLEINPRNPDVWTDLGVMNRRSKRFNEAIDDFDKAIAINPKHPQAWFNKGIVFLHNLNNPEEAVKAWEELMKIEPNFLGPGGQPVQKMIESIKISLATKKP